MDEDFTLYYKEISPARDSVSFSLTFLLSAYLPCRYITTTKQNAIKCLKRVSTPGLRKYTGYKDMPRVINGLGIAILSTSKGVMTDKEASDLKIGGEVLCYIY